MSSMPTGTVTFLFTDIEGSTARWEHHYAAMAQALPRHDALVRAAIEAHGGFVFKTVGDAFCGAFSTAAAAVQAAAAAQAALAAEEWPPHCVIRVRMALHTGAAEERAGDYFGLPLNRVARLLAVAHGGQTLLSLATQQLVRDLLPADVSLQDLGEHWLKDLIRPEHVYQLVLPGLAATFPDLRSSEAMLATGRDGAGRDSALPNPYKGLRAFNEGDAADFFGREALAARLANRLAEPDPLVRFLAVVGPSGSGKSSVVRAGLMPALRLRTLPGGGRLLITAMMPSSDPLEELEAALLRVAVNPPVTLLEQLRADERGLVRAVKRILPDDDSELLVVIDQFEEVFTLVADEAARLHFLTILCAAIKDRRSRLHIVITLRADFYDRPLLYPDPGELVRRRTEVVLPLNADELYRAITSPAGRVGVQVEPELVAAIQRDVAEQPGALPLLQYALTELFEYRAGQKLTLAAYQERGGVLGALSRRAEELYMGLTAAEGALARQIFLRLVTLGEGVEDTRRRTPLAELEALTEDGPMLDGMLELFGQYRLLTFDRDPGSSAATVEVAHEALLRRWERLRSWLADSRDALHIQRRLLTAAMEWVQSGHERSFLASGARLAQFRTLLTEATLTLTPNERAYLEESNAEYEVQAAREAARQAEMVQLLARSERLRLAAEANNAIERGESGDLAALLAIHSLRSGYTPQADAALMRALERGFTVRSFTDISIRARFSPDGAHILVGNETTLELWDIERGQQVRQFGGGSGRLFAAAFSHDGARVVAGGDSGTAHMWDVATGQAVQRFAGHTDFLFDLAFSPDGRTLLTSSLDGSACLWDLASGRQICRLQHNATHLSRAAYAPDGRSVATASDDERSLLWDVTSGQRIAAFSGHHAPVCGVAFSPDGTQLVSGSMDGTARIWDIATGQETRAFAGHSSDVFDVAFSPDGTLLLTGSFDKTARLWDVKSGRQLRVFMGMPDRVVSVEFATDGKRILTRSLDGSLVLWTIAWAPEPRYFRQHSERVTGVALSPDARYLATTSWDHTARLWDIETCQEVRTLPPQSAPLNGVVFTPDGTGFITAGNDGTARLWDVATGQERMQVAAVATGGVNAVALSADGQRLATAGDDAAAVVWDMAAGQRLQSLVGHTGQVSSIAFSPEGTMVVTGSFDKTARLWDAESGREVRQFTGHGSRIHAVAFSGDGTRVLTTGVDGTARVWDVAGGQLVQLLTGHTGTVTAAAFSPDGTSLLTGSSDKTARLWDRASGELRRVFTGHSDVVSAVAFAADGQSVFTGSWDGTAREWRIDYRHAIEVACAHLRRDLTAAERALYDIRSSEPTCRSS